jgi:N utilization substance protein A
VNAEFLGALEELERERGIDKEILLQAIEAALISAYRRNFGGVSQNVRVHLDRSTGEPEVFALKTVVADVTDPRLEVSLKDAREQNPALEIGDIVEYNVTPKTFSRIAAQTAKQVVMQRIREAERGLIYQEFQSREGDIVTGVVQRVEAVHEGARDLAELFRGAERHQRIFVNLGRTEAVLRPSDQVPNEQLRSGERIKAYVVEVKKTTKGPEIYVSRSHPGLLKRLFELEVPEIHDGVVEIKGIAREAGYRSKVSVWAEDPNVDPVGACVGPKGTRVQAIVNEIRGEKLDIIRWDPDPAVLVANALSPARVTAVTIEAETKTARVVVPDYQLSLAIGKDGQNARLAAKLTGWKVDIRSESQAQGGW